MCWIEWYLEQQAHELFLQRWRREERMHNAGKEHIGADSRRPDQA